MEKKIPNTSRRKFLKSSGSALIATGLGANVLASTSGYKFNDSDVLKVGLIGCGGRGTGAANQAMNADDKVVLTAMADIFSDRLEQSYNALKEENAEKLKVDDDHKFIGFDSYKKVLESDVDVVILTTPPSFRPGHLEAAIEAGKHIFFEKPVAVDAPGIRRVIESAKKAKEKNLAMMSGFCWRYDFRKRETYDRILRGDIGEVVSIYNTYNTGALWYKKPEPSWTEFEKTMRNWLYYNWLSGDHIAEQAVHSLDLMQWAMGDILPVKAVGTGGRQSRTEAQFGNVYDHFAIVYEYANGTKGFHFSRQQKGCARAYDISIQGNNGRSYIDVGRTHEITNSNGKDWKWEDNNKRRDINNMYQTEHDELFASIREGKPINDGIRAAHSTMLAIWGRMVAYTGKELTWEEAINSEEILGPKLDEYSWELDWKLNDVAKPGITKFG